MLILKHLKNVPTCFDHYSDHLQGARKFLVKDAAASPQSTFIILNFKNFRFSDFNKELTSSLMMISIMIETCWNVFKCYNINILD